MRRRELHAVDEVIEEYIFRQAVALKDLPEAPADRAVHFAIEVHAGAGDVAVCARIVRVRRGADADRIAERILADPVVVVHDDREHVAHALADGAGYRTAHAADHAPRQAMAVLVIHDVGVEVAVDRQRLHVGQLDGRADIGARPQRRAVGLPTNTEGIVMRGVGAAHHEDAVSLIVHDDRGRGAGILRVAHLDDEVARAAIDERDFPASEPAASASHASDVVPAPSLTSDNAPVTPVVFSAAPNSAPCRRIGTCSGSARDDDAVRAARRRVHRYICMRGFWPSPGVAKFALSVPPPSCASAFTESLPRAAVAEVVLLEVAGSLGESVPYSSS